MITYSDYVNKDNLTPSQENYFLTENAKDRIAEMTWEEKIELAETVGAVKESEAEYLLDIRSPVTQNHIWTALWFFHQRELVNYVEGL